MKQADRAIDWGYDSTATVVRKIRAGDGHPGVLDTIDGPSSTCSACTARRGLRGRPGEIIATRNGAICRATVDGAVWITHLKPADAERERLQAAGHPRARAGRQRAGRARDPGRARTRRSAGPDLPRDLLRGEAGVGYLHFEFYNGAMSTEQCQRLRDAYLRAAARTTKVIVLVGGQDFFSNGIHLNVIEAANDPAHESWRNLQRDR